MEKRTVIEYGKRQVDKVEFMSYIKQLPVPLLEIKTSVLEKSFIIKGNKWGCIRKIDSKEEYYTFDFPEGQEIHYWDVTVQAKVRSWEFTCPNCGNVIIVEQVGETYLCRQCNTTFGVMT